MAYKDPKAKAAADAAYYLKNRDHILAMRAIWRKNYPEKNRESSSNWTKNNPEKNRARNARRRARKANAPGRGITGKQWETIISLANGICSYCDKKVDALALDHIVPFDKGGAHDIDNAVPCCISCNSSKGARLLYEEWMPPKLRTTGT